MERKYTINIGDFTVNGITYPDRCLSASFGGNGTQSDVIPWAETEHQPWDYKALYEVVEEEKEILDPETNELFTTTEQVKHYTGEFELDPIEIPDVVALPTEMEQLRADVDFLLMMEA